jgi:hypothetical protein
MKDKVILVTVIFLILLCAGFLLWFNNPLKSSGNGACQLETCHGLDITCGSNPPDACTAMYQIGDKCLQYAQCGIRNDTCGQVENKSFVQCKTCVQNCAEKNMDTSEKLFACESTC